MKPFPQYLIKVNKVNKGGYKYHLPGKSLDQIFNEETKAKEFKKGEKPNLCRIRRNEFAYNDHIGGLFENQGKISKIPEVTGKPCKSDFKVLSAEANKNLNERYFYDNNLNQW